MARRRWRLRSTEKMHVLSCHFAERRRPRSTIRCAGRPSASTHSRGTDGRRDNGQRIICWCGDGPEEGGKEKSHAWRFWNFKRLHGASAGIFEGSLSKCESSNFCWFCYFGFVLFVFRRIYSHVKQVLFFGRDMLQLFYWRIRGARFPCAHFIRGESCNTSQTHST